MDGRGAGAWLLAGLVTCTLGGLSLVAAVPDGRDEVRMLPSPRQPAATLALGQRPEDGTARSSLPGVAASAPAEAASGPSVWLGSEADGDWTLTSEGQLQPSLALRRRLDWCLQAQGQLPEEQLLPTCLAHTGAHLPGPALAAVQQLWRQYRRLLSSPTRYLIHPTQPATWRLALVERQQMRRRLLGEAMAEAFYREEEAQLEAMIRQPGLLKESAALPDPAQLPPEARQRLEAELAEQQRFQALLQEARRAWQGLQAEAALSDAQRLSAIETWMSARASESERLRLRALLRLPPPAPMP